MFMVIFLNRKIIGPAASKLRGFLVSENFLSEREGFQVEMLLMRGIPNLLYPKGSIRVELF